MIPPPLAILSARRGPDTPGAFLANVLIVASPVDEIVVQTIQPPLEPPHHPSPFLRGSADVDLQSRLQTSQPNQIHSLDGDPRTAYLAVDNCD